MSYKIFCKMCLKNCSKFYETKSVAILAIKYEFVHSSQLFQCYKIRIFDRIHKISRGYFSHQFKLSVEMVPQHGIKARVMDSNVDGS